MRYVYGPISSRRLGSSLGVDIIPHKTCCFNCIYCQVGRTPNQTIERKEYVSMDDILVQVKEALKANAKIDYITFSGSGEPTLNSRIGEMIHEVKVMASIPVAVLTNGALLFRKEVRDDLLEADLVLPSLDAANQEVFEKVNRPYPGLLIEGIVEGIRKFILEFEHEVWLEVMLVKGINDSWKDVVKLASIIDRIGPARVQLNTVVRPPCEDFANALTHNGLIAIKDIIGERAEIITHYPRKVSRAYGKEKDVEAEILALIGRRPLAIEEVADSLGLHRNEIIKYISALQEEGKVEIKTHMGKQFYQARPVR